MRFSSLKSDMSSADGPASMHIREFVYSDQQRSMPNIVFLISII